MPVSFAGRRRLLEAWRAGAWVASLLGLTLTLGALLSRPQIFDLQSVVILVGLAFLAAGVFLNSPRSRRLERAIARGLRSRAKAEVDSLEEIKDAHWELVDQASHYRQLLDAQQDFVLRRSIDGHLVFANSAFCDAFDVRREDVLGSMFAPPVVRSEPAGESSGSGRRIVQLVRTREGKRWVAWDEREVMNDLGEKEIQSVGRDVTNEREIEAQLKEARDQAEAGSRAKSRFLAAMSHEIRTPMNGILGMISLMRDTPLDTEQRSCVRVVEELARALLALVDDILDFSKIEAGKLEMASEPFSLEACVAQAMQLLEQEAAAKGLSLTATVAADVPEVVRGDAKRVRQIVLNLVSNAVKFTDSGSVAVRVGMAPEGSQPLGSVRISIEVADTGIGFSPHMMQRLFDEFEQAETGAIRHPGGTGLGLAISKRLAMAMGGDINAEGTPGEGATFTATLCFETVGGDDVQISVADPAPVSPLREATAFADDECNPEAVGNFVALVAEDNRVNALLATKVIERAGGVAIVVEDGRSAIAAVWQAIEYGRPVFDLILMDVLMPGIDGLMAAKAIKALYAERQQSGATSPPIIALTANAFPEDRDRCRAAGMDDYLAKPFEAQQLQEMLLRWVSRRGGVLASQG